MRTSYKLDGLRVAQARTAILGEDGRSIKQSAFAALADLHPVTMNRIENNKARVSLGTLERISELTGRSREYLLGEDEETDVVELARARFARGLEGMRAGFEEFNAAVELLTDQARGAGAAS